jgi:anaerobic selenocysteine-containing dehydrogenase
MTGTAPDSTAISTACTVCPYCGVGCGLKVELEGGRVARVRGDATHRGTHGMLCRKAVYLPQAVNAPDRLAQPQTRLGRDQPWQAASWDVALGSAAERLCRIVAQHGPDSIAFYISGQLLTEDYYGGIQWPCRDEAGDGASRLYAVGRFATDDCRARFHVPTWRQSVNSAPELVTLMTGRERDQWHTMTRTRHVPQLLKSCPTPYVAINPSDAARLGLVEDDQAELHVVGHGESRYAVRITNDVLPGTVFVPFHWGAHRHGGGPVNTLVEIAVDPRSKQPSLKS